MAEKKRKRVIKPKPVKEDKQIMDGLNVPFEDAMKTLLSPKADNTK